MTEIHTDTGSADHSAGERPVGGYAQPQRHSQGNLHFRSRKPSKMRTCCSGAKVRLSSQTSKALAARRGVMTITTFGERWG